LRGEPQPKPERCATSKRRKRRGRLLKWAACRAFVIERESSLCQRCGRYASDDVPEWHPQRAHVNHLNGRRGDRLFDPENC
jgi:hypothetical protein